MRALGLDLGSKTLGISISDTTYTIATGLETIKFEDLLSDKVFDALDEIIKKQEINIIVLGFPKNMNNTVGPSGEKALDYKKVLEERYNINVEMQDERLSTVSATNMLIDANMSRKKRKKVIDKVASTIILQNYLDTKKREGNI